MITFIPSSMPGLYDIRFPYDSDLVELLKNRNGMRWPGSTWVGKHSTWVGKRWVVDESAVGYLADQMRSLDFPDIQIYVRPSLFPETEWPADLKPYQVSALERVRRTGNLILQWEPGSGKTRPVIELGRKVPGLTVIVAPQSTLVDVWEKQIARWAPECSEDVHRIRQGKNLPAEPPKFLLCSYGMVHKIPPEWKAAVLAFDEIHACIHGKSNQSQKCRELSLHNPQALRLGLTGTPISAHLSNLHSELDILCPGRFGSFWQWTEYYHVTDNLGFEGARRVHGLREDRLPELLERLGTVCDVVTCADLGGELPPVEWRRQSLGHARNASCALTLQHWRREQQRLSVERSAAIVDLRKGVDFSDSPARTIFITYLRRTCEILSQDLDCPFVHGGMPIKKRMSTLADAPIAVATMRAINEGIELPQFTNVFIVETYPVPLYMVQVCARFIRLGQSAPVTIAFLEFENTSDQLIAEKLLTRIKENDKLVKTGGVQSSLKEMLMPVANDESFMEELRAAFSESSSTGALEDTDTDEIWIDDEDVG